MRHKASFGPSSSSRPHPHPRLRSSSPLLVALAGCATWNPPPPRAAEQAAAACVYSGSLRVSVKGEDIRGRSRVLIAFRRPDGVRLEIPGSAGARLVAVVRGGRMTAVLPAHRAVLEGTATAADFDALLGIALAPEELMDVLVGVAPPRASVVPRRLGRARSPSGSRRPSPTGPASRPRWTTPRSGSTCRRRPSSFPRTPATARWTPSEARRLLGGR